MAVCAQHRFGVKLHPLNGQVSMAQTHYFTIVGPCRDDQISWQICFLDREGMVAVDFERLGQACEDALAKRAYHAGFAVHELL